MEVEIDYCWIEPSVLLQYYTREHLNLSYMKEYSSVEEALGIITGNCYCRYNRHFTLLFADLSTGTYFKGLDITEYLYWSFLSQDWIETLQVYANLL